MDEVRLGESCDACGADVAPADAFRGELSVGSSMCPTPMLFHKACYDRAAEMWQPDPDSYCEADPLFPETGQWMAAQNESGDSTT